MGFPLCPGRCALLPFLHTWLRVVYTFPIGLWPRGCLLSLLLGPLLWHLLSRLCCERDQVGDLMPSVVLTVLAPGMEKGLDGGTGWVYRQGRLDENKELSGQRSLGDPEGPPFTGLRWSHVPVKGADTGADAGSDVLEFLVPLCDPEATQPPMPGGVPPRTPGLAARTWGSSGQHSG